MACYKPLKAFQDYPGAKLRFISSDDGVTDFQWQLPGRALEIPCGKCIGCRSVRVKAWSIRCMHEAQMYSEPSSFVTLTYEGKDIDPSLNYKDFQRFMYRVRQSIGPTRFFMCGEYGSANFRPHFHALLFGKSFDRCERVGKDVYRSRALERLWPVGMSSVGDVTRASAAYVAGYCVKKLDCGDVDKFSRRYSRVDLRTGELVQVVPEFGHMSLKPGIGYAWFQKYWRDVFAARDGVVVNGRVCPAPRYYMDMLYDLDPSRSIDVFDDRVINAGRFALDRTPERLATRELVALSNYNRRKRDV